MSKKPPRGEATDGFGSDSFLDVVANMVGILIILVMVAGLRVKHAVDEQNDEPPAPVADLAPLESEAASLKQDVMKVFEQAKELNALSMNKIDERDALALAAAAKKQALEEARAKLASGDQEAFDLERTMEMEKVRLASLERDLESAVEQPDRESIKIKTYPTPLSRTVHGREAHFQIKDNRIVYVPLDELAELVKRELQHKVYRVRDLDEFTETVGPIGGFRLRYTMAKVKGPPHGGVSETVIGVTQLTFLPLREQLGETLEQASQPNSDFQRAISDLDPRRVTITFWAYPESFPMYRTLREQLYSRGYAVAGRPLPTGQPICGSPFGSKSSAQ
jgi:hypothetical protein